MARGQRTVTNVPPYHFLMWPTVQALRALGNSGSNQEINDKVAEIAGLTEEQLQTLHGDGPMTEVNYRLHWARTYLKRVGAVSNTSRGVWAVTEKGLSLTEDDVAEIPATVRRMILRGKTQESPSQQFELEESLDDAGSGVSDSSLLPETVFTSTDPEAWRQFLLEALLAIPPASFENLCQRLLRESGFTKVDVTGKSGDGGIDGIGVLRVSLLSFHVFFQCKRYRGSVGASAIRDFRGAMVGRTDKGLLITTGTFTADAKREATRDGAPVLDLIDGEALCMILKDLNLGVETALVEAVTVDANWFSAL